jgi:hypothetical protein
LVKAIIIMNKRMKGSDAGMYLPCIRNPHSMDALRAVLTVVMMLSVAGCLQASVPHLDFTTAPCIPPMDPYTGPPAGVLNQSWSQERMLSLEAYLNTYCAGAVITGDFAIEGDQLVLLYNITTEGPVTSCLCTHRLVYTILNIEKREYRVMIQEQ